MKHLFFKRSLVMVTILLLTGAIFIFSGEDKTMYRPAAATEGINSYSSAPEKVIPIEEPVENVLNIDTWTWYETIQDAVDAANPGERLGLDASLLEENVVVNKPVMIFGDLTMNHTVDGGSSGPTFTIEADGVAIRWLRIVNDGGYAGIEINSNDNFIYENEIDGCNQGIYLTSGTSGNGLFKNEITNSVMQGIILYASCENFIGGNTIIGNTVNGEMGIFLGSYSDNNTINANTIKDNNNGIFISTSSNNMIYHNNFVNNLASARVYGYSPGNQWHKAYPLGGNYWSEHPIIDLYHGPDQNIPGPDCYGFSIICFIDNPYYIPYGGGAHDKYPLLNQWDITCY